ncbi:MAG: hypothetical protein IJU52_03085, partial [Clostridia bacterium]|nr:hypothetical protein [Clostridia bacterium]
RCQILQYTKYCCDLCAWFCNKTARRGITEHQTKFYFKLVLLIIQRKIGGSGVLRKSDAEDPVKDFVPGQGEATKLSSHADKPHYRF